MQSLKHNTKGKYAEQLTIIYNESEIGAIKIRSTPKDDTLETRHVSLNP